MKRTIVLLFVIAACSVQAQKQVSESDIVGTWKVTRVSMSGTFEYDAIKNKLLPGNAIQYSLDHDKDGKMKEVVEKMRSQIAKDAAGRFFMFDNQKEYKYVTSEQNERGVYLIENNPQAPDVNASEDDFLLYANCYGYFARIQNIITDGGNKKYNINIILKDDAFELSLAFRSPPNLMNKKGSMMVIGFKKVNEGDAASIKKQAEADRLAFEKQKAKDETEAKIQKEKNEAAAKASKEKETAEKNKKDEEAGGKIYYSAQQEPAYPGGNEAWSKFLTKTVNFSTGAENGATESKYTVTVSFTVNTDGSISNVAVDNDPGYGMGKEAIRVINRSGSWIPAVQDGQKVRFRYKKNIPFISE
jgi:hypothetical protein